MYNYYNEQLQRIDTKGEFNAKVQFSDHTGTKTNHLDLNNESAKEIISFLRDNFKVNHHTIEDIKTRQIENFHTLKAQYKGATNTRGSRVIITSDRFEQSITIGYNYEFDNALEIAEDWLLKNGFVICGHSEQKDHYLVITETFKPLKTK